ncbi:hypothetical protein SCLCIDRAFT_860436 [Scleroderma citrinum Foug A]|uniref:Uncharacterized protein n=1 Tax=Scleroderma citrinum Foug A TaxID=1036808 RepID=A0A0C2ZJU2_9AGAM|nr:hypothetical protein SCLCIDRAFT_860436 [Scleroderma citrinum Foug A]
MGLLWVPVSHYDVQCHRHRGNSKKPDRYRTQGHPALLPPRGDLRGVRLQRHQCEPSVQQDGVVPAPRCKHEATMPWSAVRLGACEHFIMSKMVYRT